MHYVSLIGLVAFASLILAFAKGIYNVFFHPLRTCPGPKLWATTSLIRLLMNTMGTMDHKLVHFHDKYGAVVRYGPNAVSFISQQAWKDIYGYGSRSDRTQLRKVTTRPRGAPTHLINADDQEHQCMRKQLAVAFSEQNYRNSISVLTDTVEDLLDVLGRACDQEERVELTDLFGWTAWRLILDYCFGKSGEVKLEDAPVKIFRLFAIIPFYRLQEVFPFIGMLYSRMMEPSAWGSGRLQIRDFSRRLVSACAKGESDQRRITVISRMTSSELDTAFSPGQVITTSINVLAAGSETMGTVLCGFVYCLCNNPDAQRTLVSEIHSVFESEADIITNSSAARTPYLMACINEAMRIYPPSPSVFPRQTPPDKTTEIAGLQIPGNTIVGVHQLAAYMNELNFHKPAEFRPERWMENRPVEFASDERGVFQPFHVGPRDCAGRVLAMGALRIILARVFYTFDLRLDKGVIQWNQQKIYQVYEKNPLYCEVKKNAMNE